MLDAIKAAIGVFYFAAQYQQSLVPEEGNFIKWEWFGRFVESPQPEFGGRIVQSWDFAVKDGEQNDWPVCLTAYIKGNAIFILDILRQRLNYPTQREAVIRLARQHKALMEGAANGSPLVSDLLHLGASDVPTPIPVTPRGSKVERIAAHSHRVEAGDVRLPGKADWLDAFQAEVLAFPRGRCDDQVDALSQLLGWTERQRSSFPIGIHGPKVFSWQGRPR